MGCASGATVALDVAVWFPANASLVFGLPKNKNGCSDAYAATLLPVITDGRMAISLFNTRTERDEKRKKIRQSLTTNIVWGYKLGLY